VLTVLGALTAVLLNLPGLSGPASAADSLLSAGRPATASTTESPAFPASAAVDGDPGTRWSSAFADGQWLQVDLGRDAALSRAVLTWEVAYATAYTISAAPGPDGPWTTLATTTAGRGGTETVPLSGSGRYVRLATTTRATPWGVSLWQFDVYGTAGGAVTTTTTGAAGAFWGDTATIPAARNVLTVKVLNRTNGRYPDSQVFWSFGGQTHSIAEQPYLDLPANEAGRMSFALGSPEGRYRDFIEFTVGADVFNGNTTRVDAFGLKLAMRLHAHDGYDVAVGENEATFAEDRDATFRRFAEAMPAELKSLATIAAPDRIPNPAASPDLQPGGRYADYLSRYAASVGVNATTQQIIGCSGPLAQAPDLCAALNRHTAHLPAARQGDPAEYYRAAPFNAYAKFWHDNAIGGKAYGFPYDDVAAQSSFVSHGDPQYLLVAVGW
jgi:hypothetical protein